MIGSTVHVQIFDSSSLLEFVDIHSSNNKASLLNSVLEAALWPAAFIWAEMRKLVSLQVCSTG